mgnify:CR=1 FL=1
MHILKISALSCTLLLDSFFGASTALNTAENESNGTYWFEVERSSGERSIAGIPDDTIEEPAAPIGDGIIITGLLAICYSKYKRRKA